MIDYRALMVRKVPKVLPVVQSEGKNTGQLDDLKTNALGCAWYGPRENIAEQEKTPRGFALWTNSKTRSKDRSVVLLLAM